MLCRIITCQILVRCSVQIKRWSGKWRLKITQTSQTAERISVALRLCANGLKWANSLQRAHVFDNRTVRKQVVLSHRRRSYSRMQCRFFLDPSCPIYEIYIKTLKASLYFALSLADRLCDEMASLANIGETSKTSLAPSLPGLASFVATELSFACDPELCCFILTIRERLSRKKAGISSRRVF